MQVSSQFATFCKPLLSIFLLPTFKIQRPTSVKGAASAKRLPSVAIQIALYFASYSSQELIDSSLTQMKIETEKTASQVTAEALKDEGNVLFSHGKKYSPNNEID
jgi:hypothetical protein